MMGRKRVIFGVAVLAAVTASALGQAKPVGVIECTERYNLTLYALATAEPQLPEGDLHGAVEGLIGPTEDALAVLRHEPEQAGPRFCGEGPLSEIQEIVERLHELGYPLSDRELADRRLNDIRAKQVEGLERLRCNAGTPPPGLFCGFSFPRGNMWIDPNPVKVSLPPVYARPAASGRKSRGKD